MKKSIFIIALVALALNGCAAMREKKSEYIKNHANDYLKSSVIAPLRIPAGLSTPERENLLYPLPENLPAAGTVTQPSVKPPGFGKLS